MSIIGGRGCYLCLVVVERGDLLSWYHPTPTESWAKRLAHPACIAKRSEAFGLDRCDLSPLPQRVPHGRRGAAAAARLLLDRGAGTHRPT